MANLPAGDRRVDLNLQAAIRDRATRLCRGAFIALG